MSKNENSPLESTFHYSTIPLFHHSIIPCAGQKHRASKNLSISVSCTNFETFSWPLGGKLQKGGFAMKGAILIIILILCLAIPGVSLADDTEIYGTATISLEPNILIIFDTSGSMSTQDVYEVRYDPNTTYEGSYPANKVYRKIWGGWSDFANDVNDIACTEIKDDLLANGYAVGKIKSDTTCGGWSTRTLRTGNYRNYEAVQGASSRISVAQTVVKGLINDSENIRFGLMRFNGNDGGRIVAECGTSKGDLISSVNALTADDWTPLAETLAEAGLYFAGMDSWFNSGVTYTSPMQERCQKNYIIIMTDGEPTQDRNWRLTSGTYINGDNIGDYDNDGDDFYSDSDNEVYQFPPYNPSDYLDDVAKYLYERDCNPALGTGTSFERQNIITYTIGFKSEQQLLQDTATNGGGEYYTANNISGLSESFEEIMASISDANAVFVSPVVPVSRMNRAYTGNFVYLGFFNPQPSGRWHGNLKKYGLGSSGEILDADGVEATLPDGTIKDNARSYWSSSPDGPNVTAGGAGEVLLDQTSRNLYTYMDTQASLTHTDNQFSTENSLVTNSVLNVSSDTERTDLINDVYGGESSWIMGDIIHSQPAVVHYDTNGDGELDSSFIFLGTNDGMLHCFDDSDGSEVWGFIPPDQLGRLPLLLNDDHDYFVDGSPVVYEGTSQKILIFGERRGGDHYYALDVTTPNAPSWLYKIEPTILAGEELGDEQLGQSWSRPEIHTIKTGSETEDTVFLIAGGYDTNQDLPNPELTDSVGRAIFTVKATNGTVSTLNFHAGNYSDMTHSIVDVSGFDSNGDGYMNRVYAGDLGGAMFAFEGDNGDGTWSSRKLFSASADDSVQRKIFNAPDAVEESFGEIIFFGTGDRADPGETGVENRLYAIKNEWLSSETLTESDLVDVTDDLIQLGTAEQKELVQTALETSKGWYIRLENQGEKMTSSPTVFAGAVYFTTYTPNPEGGGSEDDPCYVPTARGIARLYAVDYLTGVSVHDWSEEVEIDQETGEAAVLGKLDRTKVIGTSIPSAPVIAVLESGPKIFTGVEGGVTQEEPVAKPDMNIYYWRQFFVL